MALTLVTAPAVLPIGLQEAKDHLRVTTSDDDALIDALLPTVVRRAEGFLGRALLTQTWDWFLDGFDAVALLSVPKPPLQSVTSIEYIDTAGVEQTWDASLYKVDSDSQPGRVRPAYGEVFPSTRSEMGAVTIRLVAGYGAGVASVPAEFKSAMLVLLTGLYANRGGKADKIINDAFEALLWPERMTNF